jgi:hypothetical protein
MSYRKIISQLTMQTLYEQQIESKELLSIFNSAKEHINEKTVPLEMAIQFYGKRTGNTHDFALYNWINRLLSPAQGDKIILENEISILLGRGNPRCLLGGSLPSPYIIRRCCQAQLELSWIFLRFHSYWHDKGALDPDASYWTQIPLLGSSDATMESRLMYFSHNQFIILTFSTLDYCGHIQAQKDLTIQTMSLSGSLQVTSSGPQNSIPYLYIPGDCLTQLPYQSLTCRYQPCTIGPKYSFEPVSQIVTGFGQIPRSYWKNLLNGVNDDYINLLQPLSQPKPKPVSCFYRWLAKISGR